MYLFISVMCVCFFSIGMARLCVELHFPTHIAVFFICSFVLLVRLVLGDK